MSIIEQIAAILGSYLGPTWQHRLVMTFMILFLASLLVDRMWLLLELKRDVAELKADLPRMKDDIKHAQTTADEAKNKAEMSAVELAKNNTLLAQLNQSVLNLPSIIVNAMRSAR